MDGNTLGALMMANVDALTDAQKKDRAAVFAALGSAVVIHIQSTAVIVGLIVAGGGGGVAGGGPGVIS